MASLNLALTPHVSEALKAVKRLTPTERLVLARLLLDSVLTTEVEDEADWSNLGLMAFEAEWDNPEDAIYDNWRELYAVSAR